MNFALLCYAQVWEMFMKMQISAAAKQTFRRENKIVRRAEKLGKQKNKQGTSILIPLRIPAKRTKHNHTHISPTLVT